MIRIVSPLRNGTITAVKPIYLPLKLMFKKWLLLKQKQLKNPKKFKK